jgi:hypothetical protein
VPDLTDDQELQPLPAWINLDGFAEPDLIRKREALVKRGEAMLPAFAAWVRDASKVMEWPDLNQLEDPLLALVLHHIGLSDLDALIEKVEMLSNVFRYRGESAERIKNIQAEWPELFASTAGGRTMTRPKGDDEAKVGS